MFQFRILALGLFLTIAATLATASYPEHRGAAHSVRSMRRNAPAEPIGKLAPIRTQLIPREPPISALSGLLLQRDLLPRVLNSDASLRQLPLQLQQPRQGALVKRGQPPWVGHKKHRNQIAQGGGGKEDAGGGTEADAEDDCNED